MNKLFILFFIVVASVKGLAQTAVQIQGVVSVENASAEGIHVTNLVSEKSTVTNEKGEFWLEVKEDDLLVFSAVHLNYWRKSISATDIRNGYIEVEMTVKEEKLDLSDVDEILKMINKIKHKPK